jgi:DNA invertase Pin-like site-specific DNA recombinase
MRAAIYLRVSTDEQTTANQERELQAAAERIGHEIVAVYRSRTARSPTRKRRRVTRVGRASPLLSIAPVVC